MGFRQRALYAALLFVVALLIIDRSAAYLYRPDPDAKEVVIYTTKSCPYCKMLRAYLEKHLIPYTDHDIYSSPAGIMGFWTLRGRGVPVSTIGPDIIHGYNIKKIEESLAKLGYRIISDPRDGSFTPGTPVPATPVH